MLRHFLLGFGVSLILIFIILLSFNLELVNLAELDEEFVIEKVREKELEKDFIEEAKKEFEAEITEEYIIEEAEKLGMNFENRIFANKIVDEFISQNYFTSETLFSETEFLISDITEDEIEIKKNSDLESDGELEEIKEKKEEMKTDKEETINLFIRSGMNAREVAWLLKEEGLISDVNSFILLVHRFNMEDKIMAGSYNFSSDIDTLRLLLEMTI